MLEKYHRVITGFNERQCVIQRKEQLKNQKSQAPAEVLPLTKHTGQTTKFSLESIASFKRAPDTVPMCSQTLLRGSTEINIVFKNKPHMTRLIGDILLRGYLCMGSHIRNLRATRVIKYITFL